MKRTIALFLCMALLVPFALNATPAQAEALPTITCENVTCKPGEQITVAVTVSNNPGFAYLEMTPTYASELTLVAVANGDLASDFTKGKQYVWIADEDVTTDGLLMTFTFQVAETVAPGEYSVDFVIRTCGNYDEEPVQFTVNAGTVTVVNAGVVEHTYVDNGEEKTVSYETLEEALAVATSGTIKLLADVAVSNLIVNPDITLDLNGYTLAADLVVVLDGATILDGGAKCAGGGLLKVDEKKLAFVRQNGQSVLPVWNGVDGYVFTKASFQQLARKGGEGAAQYIFLPTFSNKAVTALMADGGTDNGLTFEVCMSWAGGLSRQYFTYEEIYVEQVFDGTYRWVFDLQVTGLTGITDMVASPVIIADSGTQVTTTGVALVAGE